MNDQVKTEVCKDHGEYPLRKLDMLEKWVGSCPECTALLHAKESAAELAKKRQTDIRLRETLGISKRNMFKTFDDFIVDENFPNQQHAKDMFIRLSKSLDDGTAFNIIAMGNPGTGKTLLASALIESQLPSKRVYMVKAIDLMRQLKETFRKFKDSKRTDPTERSLIEHYSNLPLLIIDEIGLQFGSDTEKIFIFDIIDGRYQNMLPTVLMSNLDRENIKKLIGERVIDRLREGGGKVVPFDWDSKR